MARENVPTIDFCKNWTSPPDKDEEWKAKDEELKKKLQEDQKPQHRRESPQGPCWNPARNSTHTEIDGNRLKTLKPQGGGKEEGPEILGL